MSVPVLCVSINSVNPGLLFPDTFTGLVQYLIINFIIRLNACRVGSVINVIIGLNACRSCRAAVLSDLMLVG